MSKFAQFKASFPSALATWKPVDSDRLTALIEKEFSINVPEGIAEFWGKVGAGYWGRNELCLFGDEGLAGGRDSLIAWNRKDWWRKIYPPPEDGGPVFFGDTCFGDQLGFRWEGNVCLPIIFCVDTFDSYVIGESVCDALENTLGDRNFIDQKQLRAVEGKLGRLKSGMHFAPIVSPLVGGSNAASNYDMLIAHVHVELSIATYFAVRTEE